MRWSLSDPKMALGIPVRALRFICGACIKAEKGDGLAWLARVLESVVDFNS